MTVGLNYNSQNWQKLGSVEWRVGKDTGFGFGWRMLVGSVAPVYENNAIVHYVLADSTGAEYKLAQHSAGVWNDNSSPLGGYAVNGWGRLTSVAYKAYSGSRVFAEGYPYTAGGLVAAKKMRPLPTRLRSAGRGRWRRSNRSTTRRS